MNDEVMPVGTAARLKELEAEVERLREKLLIACYRGDVADAEVGRLQADTVVTRLEFAYHQEA